MAKKTVSLTGGNPKQLHLRVYAATIVVTHKELPFASCRGLMYSNTFIRIRPPRARDPRAVKFFSELKNCFLGTLILLIYFFTIKIIIFRGDLTDISAKTATLSKRVRTASPTPALTPRLWNSSNNSVSTTVRPLIIESFQAQKTSVYRGTRGSRRSACGPNGNLKERLSFCRYYPASLVIFILMLSANCEIKIQMLVIQYERNSIITGPTVGRKGCTIT